MSEMLSADDLRARLSGVKPQTDPPMVEVPQANPDLVSSTLQRYRDNKPKGLRRGVAAMEAATPPPPPPQARRANTYGAKCVLCEVWVAPGEGYLTKDGQGKWAAEHQAGECSPEDPVAAAVATLVTEVPPGFVKIVAITGQTYVGLQPGIYTLETDAGHRTFRVRVQGTEEEFAPGKTILEYLSGPDNERDYTGFAFLNGTRLAVWKKHQDKADLLADAREFLTDPSKATLAASCIRCNATLSTPESIAALMGPTCRNKGW